MSRFVVICGIDLARVVNLCPFALNSHNDLSSGRLWRRKHHFICQSILPCCFIISDNSRIKWSLFIFIKIRIRVGYIHIAFGTDNYLPKSVILKLSEVRYQRIYVGFVCPLKAMQVSTDYFKPQAWKAIYHIFNDTSWTDK